MSFLFFLNDLSRSEYVEMGNVVDQGKPRHFCLGQGVDVLKWVQTSFFVRGFIRMLWCVLHEVGWLLRMIMATLGALLMLFRVYCLCWSDGFALVCMYCGSLGFRDFRGGRVDLLFLDDTYFLCVCLSIGGSSSLGMQ